MLQKVYETLSSHSGAILERLIAKRIKNNKEDPQRINERKGITALKRPGGYLLWLHAASVGEAQSALKIIDEIHQADNTINILITTGTRTSAQLVGTKEKPNTIHQYAPFDHPKWVERFINHWHPDAALWIESELWPNMLAALRRTKTPALLINARLSEKSYQFWKRAPSLAQPMLKTFSKILCQTERDALNFRQLGHSNTTVTDNIKYAANPLPFNKNDFKHIEEQTKQRDIILYASTHYGEERIAANIHNQLSKKFPKLLTIIVPRHPERGGEVKNDLQKTGMNVRLRSEHNVPDHDTDIFIVNSLGELGLFYCLSPIAYIGRSLSDDGGGGHNPIEAALLNTAIVCGPHVQNLQDIYNQMIEQNAVKQVNNETELLNTLKSLLADEKKQNQYKENATNFVKTKNHVIENVMSDVYTLLINNIKND